MQSTTPSPRLSLTPEAPAAPPQVGDFWRAAMDTAAIERAGASPLSDLLALVESAVSGYTPIAEVVAQFHVASVRVFFTFGAGGTSHIIPSHRRALSLNMPRSRHCTSNPPLILTGDGPDAKNSTWSIAQVRQGGLGLPDRDYYFAEDKADIRTKCGTGTAGNSYFRDGQ